MSYRLAPSAVYPALTDTDVDRERHGKRKCVFHTFLEYTADNVGFVVRRFDYEFVVYLENET